ncbi:hypothetical protein L3H50_07120 [Corynebacterium sp. MC-04]|uniref:Secreted protein n=1 Tax=Corynebacterium parakroppenstedtii TaxID=2828363 RepID=A0ABS9HK84_9CORY|nr:MULTISPECIES: hypothetical protein [Corynebacterium]MDU3196832.1 hypothetical protein [Corynebacterium kroppenstedtii]MBY0788625.1 hypothetical protein [Corynebacterium parakroppenstedtii]MBY0792685.1 hypothetical protein [Corynebacterium parakroppenstedtii]MBY0796788.1 hypothetical protein [Corynebacterium parakroppenstedtii]MCF6770042.1 hypothetical protein [Corynebacterium parakroppenstedtii]
MKISSMKLSLPACLLAMGLLTGVGLAASNASNVRADDQGDYVSFGDSLAANPNMLQILAGRNPVLGEVFKTPKIPAGYCATGQDIYANRMGNDTGVPVKNYACSGAQV